MPFPTQPPGSVPCQVITLNSIDYRVRDIEVETVRNWGEVYSPVGGQLRAAQAGGASWNMSPHKGFGLDLLNNFADDYGFFIDSTLETRFGKFVTLPGLWVAEASWTPNHPATPNTVEKPIVGGVNFDSEIWVLESLTVATVPGIYARRFDETGTPAWDTTELIVEAATNVMRPFDLKAHGGVLVAAFDSRVTGTEFRTYTRAVGGTWTNRTGIATILPAAYDAADRVLLCSIGSRLYYAVWDSSLKIVRCGYSDDNGATATLGDITIPTASQPTGFCGAWNGSAWVPHLGTAEGLWELSAAAAAPIKILPLEDTYSVWNCLNMAVWENGGDLYIPLGGNPLGQLVRYHYDGAKKVFSMVGFDNTSWPAARQGRIVALKSTPRWLLALVQNTGSTECGIFAADGVGYHHLYNSDTSSGGWPTTGSPVPQAFGVSNVDGTQRLHLVWDNGTTADACHMKNPLEDPTTVSGFVYEALGYLTWPWFGGDTLEFPKGFYKVWGVGDLLTATETITYAWAQDGGSSFTDLTALTASGSTNFPSTSSSVGLSAKTLQMKMTLARDTTTTLHPVVRASVLSYDTVPTTRLRFILKGIDLAESLAHQENATTKVDAETMITNLETARDSVTLVAFVYPYGSTAKRVKVLPESFQGVYTITRDTDGKPTQQRTGFVSMVVEER